MLSLVLIALAAAHPYNVRDQVSMNRLQSFSVARDASAIVYTLRSTDLEANRGRTDLYWLSADGSQTRQLTNHPENDSDAVFSNDGKFIYFLSDRANTTQVFKLNLSGGDPVQVTQSVIDIASFRVSPDGKMIAFAADVFVDCDTLACTDKRLAEQRKSKSTGKIYDSLFVRHWDTFRDGRRSHLFVTKIDNFAPVDVTKGVNADAPSKPFGGHEEFTFSADSKTLVYTARVVGREESWSTDLDLFQVPVDGSKPAIKLTTQNRATDTHPLFSPDGKMLAYLAMKRPGFEADRQYLMLRDMASGQTKTIAENWDRSVEDFRFSEDGKTIFATAQDVGQLGIFAIGLADGKVAPRQTTGNVSAFELLGNSLYFLKDTLDAPTDLFVAEAQTTKAAKQLTRVNEKSLKDIQFGSYEQFNFTGAHNETVYGYIVKPTNFSKDKKYPLAFLIHGGPQGSFGNHFHYRWNPQIYAAHGYVAVMIDFHGSTGYGQAFTDAIRNDWGGAPLEDLKKGVEAALKKYSFIDRNRMCALGASYGGYMINWIAGQWSDGFKCLVNHDGNLDERMAYFDTEELWFPEWEHGGTPWQNQEGYTKHNPIDHVAKWKTPMLVIHGGRDYRVVDTQGMSTFTALQRRGIESKFLYFPDENHWVLKPANSVLWHDTVLGWLDKYTK